MMHTFRGLDADDWSRRLIQHGWPSDWAAAFALFLTDEGPLPGWGCPDIGTLAKQAGELAEEGRLLREQLLTVTKERDEAWAKIDQLLGRDG